MQRWQGRVAVVTGASAGIGAAIAASLAKAGMVVVGFARRPELVEEQAKALAPARLVARQCDVSQEADVKASFAWVRAALGGVDVLVNNAGVINESRLSGLVKSDIFSYGNMKELTPDKMFGEDYMEPQDIADAVVYVLGTPERVQIQELIIKPTGAKY
ncbi:Dehydrogenase/reductase SDR family member 11 [Gryllus bimaculatus]|nr:Dehydrogenase/reductase SDR family member 11 [Gryllus bimaculatus]